jgi:hypothetical protein
MSCYSQQLAPLCSRYRRSLRKRADRLLTTFHCLLTSHFTDKEVAQASTISTTPTKENALKKGHDPLPQMFPPLNSAFDKFDKALTYKIQKFVPLLHLEYPLSVVGTWHGIPLTSMAFCPLALASISCPFIYLRVLVGLLFTALLGVWFWAIANDCHEKFYMIEKATLMVAVLTAQAVATIVGVAYDNEGSPGHIASWYLCSYLFTQLIILFIKVTCKRMRRK